MKQLNKHNKTETDLQKQGTNRCFPEGLGEAGDEWNRWGRLKGTLNFQLLKKKWIIGMKCTAWRTELIL